MKLPDTKEAVSFLKEFTHDGFTLHQFAREGMVAIYEKSRSPGSVKRFELVVLQHRPAEIICGKPYPARECYPNSKEWGQRGWTFLTLDSAQRGMQQHIQEASQASFSPPATVYGASEAFPRVKTAEEGGERSYRRHVTQ